MEADNLEKTIAIFEKFACDIPIKRLEAWISNKNPTVIVKFLQRKDCQQVWDAQRDLRKIKMQDIDWPDACYFIHQ